MIGLLGTIQNPTKYASTQGQGLFTFLGNALKLTAAAAGIYMIIQFIMAGFEYISAEGDPKKIAAAWTKIWQSMLGLVIIAAAFILAGVVGRITGINILNPEIYGPTP